MPGSLILIYQGLQEGNLDQKSPGPAGCGLMLEPAPCSILKTKKIIKTKHQASEI
jgi:hypothetical protein